MTKTRWFIEKQIEIYKETIKQLKWICNYDEKMYPPAVNDLEISINTLEKLIEDMNRELGEDYED